MKKTVAIIIAVLSFTLLAACGSGKDDTSAPASASDLPQTQTETPAAEPAQDSPATGSDIPAQATASPAEFELNAATEGLMAAIGGISGECQPGTAGSSLVSVKYAGTLLDWYEANDPDESEITAVMTSMFGAFTEDAKAAFPEQLDGVYYAAVDLGGSGAEDALASAGYEPTSYPWSERDVEKLFTALYAGIGAALPE